ncbi:hypothetical protein J437_LFUL019152 [Ladona fulva]|uniref:Uncharacterized protein n=1 Tax=Ladona fulva TaxID=123851 RepID=A0A8K0KQ52_LADFU|nr:hypothetical protein J437_LFUL019152 [Ladona fulva]
MAQVACNRGEGADFGGSPKNQIQALTIKYAIGKMQIGKLSKDQEEILKIWQENGNHQAKKKL